jgi:hypothetical protein
MPLQACPQAGSPREAQQLFDDPLLTHQRREGQTEQFSKSRLLLFELHCVLCLTARLKRKKRKEVENRERKARREKKRPDLTFKVQVRAKISHTVKSLSGSVDLPVQQRIQVLLFMHFFLCLLLHIENQQSNQTKTPTNTTFICFIVAACCFFCFVHIAYVFTSLLCYKSAHIANTRKQAILTPWNLDEVPMHASAWFPRILGNEDQPHREFQSIWEVTMCKFYYTMQYKMPYRFNAGEVVAAKISGDADYSNQYSVTVVSLTLDVWFTVCCSLFPCAYCTFVHFLVWCVLHNAF